MDRRLADSDASDDRAADLFHPNSATYLDELKSLVATRRYIECMSECVRTSPLERTCEQCGGTVDVTKTVEVWIIVMS